MKRPRAAGACDLHQTTDRARHVRSERAGDFIDSLARFGEV
jgi:hypothetical protein